MYGEGSVKTSGDPRDERAGTKSQRSSSLSPWLAALVQFVMVTGFMLAFHFPLPMIVGFGLFSFFIAALSLRLRQSAATRQPVSGARSLSPQPLNQTLLGLAIAFLGFAFVACALFGFVAFMNAHNAVQLVEGQPYHATTFQVIRPYYQKSAGMHGPEISIYASGMVEGRKEWMSLYPYLKRYPSGQDELNALVPTGAVIPIYLFPGLKGRNRVQIIDALPPGEANRRTETWVLRHVPLTLTVLAALIFLLVRMRRSRASSATAKTMAASA